MSGKSEPKSKKAAVSLGRRAEEELARLEATQRTLVADFCRVVEARVRGRELRSLHAADKTRRMQEAGLTPRMQQILERLLEGDSEKQIALRLKISPHTVHTYVKQLHKKLGVNSRGELLARFVV